MGAAEEGLYYADAEGKKRFVLRSQVGTAADEGLTLLPGQSVTSTDTTSGRRSTVSGEDFVARRIKDSAVSIADQGTVQGMVDKKRRSELYGGIANQAAAGAAGVARGMTFGLSDAALTGLDLVDGEDLRGIRDEHAATSLIGELGGAVVPGLLTGGAGSAGALARMLPSGALALRAGKTAEAIGGIRGAVIAGGLEGSVFGAGQAVSNLALDDEPLTAEAIFSEIGTGALLGGAMGAAGGAFGAGLEVAGEKMVRIGGKVKESLVKRATPALDISSKEGKALYQSLKSSTDELDELVERAVAKAENRSATGFRFAADDDVAETSFRALQKQKSEALDYAQAAGGKLPANIEKAAARVEVAEQKIASLLSNRRGSLDFGKASSLDQKKLGTLSKAFDEYNGAVGKLASETGSPFTSAGSPVSSGILQKLDGADELAKSAREAHGIFREKLGKKGIEGLGEQTPEQAMATVRALQEATDRAGILAKQIGGKEAASLARINDDIIKAIGGASEKKLPEVAELALILGIEEALIPDIDGPADELLKLYLATRMMGKMSGAGGLASQALSKFAGKLPGAKVVNVADGFVSDTIGKLASATGKATERISSGLQKTLKTSAKAVKRSSPLTTQVLSDVSFGEQGDGKKPRDKRQAFALRSEELSSAVANMPAVEARVSERLEGLRHVAPGVAEKVAAHTSASLQFLHEKMPKDPGVLQRFGKSQWRPTDGELDKFSRYVHAVKDPAGIVERFGEMRMTREDGEVLRTLYPAHYRKAQMWIMDNLDTLAKKSTYRQRVQMSLFMNTPADPIMSKAAVWQKHFEPVQEQQPQQPQSQKLGGTNRESETAAQQLLEMK